MSINGSKSAFADGVNETIGLQNYQNQLVSELTTNGIKSANLQGQLTLLRNASEAANKTSKAFGELIKGLI